MSAESFCCEWCGDQLLHHSPTDEQYCAAQAAAWERLSHAYQD